MCHQQRLRPACAYAQADQSLCWSLKYSMIVKLLTEPHLRFLSLKGGCTGSSESTLVKMPHCWKSRAMAQFLNVQEIFTCFPKVFHLCQICFQNASQIHGCHVQFQIVLSMHNYFLKLSNSVVYASVSTLSKQCVFLPMHASRTPNYDLQSLNIHIPV